MLRFEQLAAANAKRRKGYAAGFCCWYPHYPDAVRVPVRTADPPGICQIFEVLSV
jgi:hypothetical protein